MWQNNMKKINMLKNSYGGKLIVFESPDGSGKTTLAGLTMDYLKANKKEYVYVKMPSDRMRKMDLFNDYDNSTNNAVRDTIDLTNLTIFVSGDRLITLNQDIIPALKQNKYVICDRYAFTGYVRCNDEIIRLICERFIKPETTFLLKCKSETLKARVKSRKNEKDNYYNDKEVEEQIKRFDMLSKLQNFVEIDSEKDIKDSFEIIKKYL